MKLTLQDVLHLNEMGDSKVIVGMQNVEDSIIDWVSVIETPVENFVRKNEFVLSTGVGCGHDEKLLYQFVQEIIDSEASGLALAMGRYIKKLPLSVISLAERYSFPIIEMPWKVRFADIIQSIMQARNRQKDQFAERSEELQQKMLQLILKGGDISEVANFVYKIINFPVIVTDKRGFIKGNSKNAKTMIDDWYMYLKEEDYALSLNPLEASQHVAAPNMRYIHVNDHYFLQLMIQSANEVQGYLLVGKLPEDTVDMFLSDANIQLLQHAVTAIALCFLKENTVRETEMRLRDDFVWSLAKGTIKSWDIVLSRGKTLGYKVNLPYVALIILPENFSSIFKSLKIDHSSYEHWLQNIIRSIEDEIFYAGKNLNIETMTTYQKDQFIVFLESDKNGNEKLIKFIEMVESRLDQLAPKLITSWGIGKSNGINYFHESYHQAQMALEIGRRQKGPGHHTTYADTRLDRALMNLVSSKELKDVTNATLGALLKYEKERGIDLINTYSYYSKNRGNVSQTARELNLHRQSLLYRLRKIESLTGCSLDHPDDVFLLDLTIKLWTIGILD